MYSGKIFHLWKNKTLRTGGFHTNTCHYFKNNNERQVPGREYSNFLIKLSINRAGIVARRRVFTPCREYFLNFFLKRMKGMYCRGFPNASTVKPMKAKHIKIHCQKFFLKKKEVLCLAFVTCITRNPQDVVLHTIIIRNSTRSTCIRCIH